jgi:hypothetical protein
VTAPLLVNLAATLFMTGLIWFVQVVHYPLFAAVGRDAFAAYHAAHSRRTTAVVMPVMVAEALTALLLAWRPPPGVPAAAGLAGLALVAVVWASTGLAQVPCHTRLGAGFDAATIRVLVSGNRVRTAAWSARAALLLWMVSRVANA